MRRDSACQQLKKIDHHAALVCRRIYNDACFVVRERAIEPEDIAAAIIGHLKAALEEIETLSEELEPEGVEKPGKIAEAAE